MLPKGCEIWFPRSSQVNERMSRAIQDVFALSGQADDATADGVRKMAVFRKMAIVVSRNYQSNDLASDWRSIHGVGILVPAGSLNGRSTEWVRQVTVDRIGQHSRMGAAILEALVNLARQPHVNAAKVRVDLNENPALTYQICRAQRFDRIGPFLYELTL